MKKRILGTMMAISVMVGSVMPVSAAQLHTDGETANVQLSYDNQSTFCINIPESIDLNNPDGYTFTADYVNITDSEEVCVSIPDEAIQMTNEWGANGTVRFTTNSVRFLRDQTTAETPVYAMFDGLSAGHFEGTATFTIQLKQRSNQ